MVEILLLSGGTPYANFKDLAHAWGREKGFHHVLANSICERRGEVERKRRSDAGRSMSSEQREMFKQKLRRTKFKGDDGEEDDDNDNDNGGDNGSNNENGDNEHQDGGEQQQQQGDEDQDVTMNAAVDPVQQQEQEQSEQQHGDGAMMEATQEVSV